jgi:hypothetical protein
MRRFMFLFCTTVFMVCALHAAPPTSPAGWKAKVDESIPLLGHRNWILVADSAYPLQSSPGIETIETNGAQLEVVQYVLGAIKHSIHVRPLIFMDSELSFVPDADAPGVSGYRTQVLSALKGYSIEQRPHENLIAGLDQASSHFHVLVLKTNMTIPYTSVFIRLDCKYWSDDAETRMREKMEPSRPGSASPPAGKSNQ